MLLVENEVDWVHDEVVEEDCRQGRRNAGGVFPAIRDCSRLRTAGRITVDVDILR